MLISPLQYPVQPHNPGQKEVAHTNTWATFHTVPRLHAWRPGGSIAAATCQAVKIPDSLTQPSHELPHEEPARVGCLICCSTTFSNCKFGSESPVGQVGDEVTSCPDIGKGHDCPGCVCLAFRAQGVRHVEAQGRSIWPNEFQWHYEVYLKSTIRWPYWEDGRFFRPHRV